MNQVQDPSKTTASGPEQYPDRLHLSRPSKSMKKSMIMSDGTVAGEGHSCREGFTLLITHKQQFHKIWPCCHLLAMTGTHCPL
jgi:hypothetical protein